jgi:hypothetical protein
MGVDVVSEPSRCICEVNELRICFRINPDRELIVAVPQTAEQSEQVYRFVMR